jgi:8-oxo-dGTP diphosphatase
VLIVLRSKQESGSDGSTLTWVYPGGSAKHREPLVEAVIREVAEESGCTVTVEKLIVSKQHPQFAVQISYFKCQYQGGEINIQDPEISEARWILPSQIPNYFTTNID